VVSVNDNGTAANTGVLATGFGPIILDKVVPSNAVLTQLIPNFALTIQSSVITTMIDLIFANQPFGLRYGYDNNSSAMTWQIVFESNLNTISGFSLGNQGNATNTQQDSSWILLFTTDNQFYTITTRLLRYVFESNAEISFYFDSSQKIYDIVSSSTIIDNIKVLSINTQPDATSAFTVDFDWQVISDFVGLDGYVDPSKVVVAFADSQNDGIVDNPQLFLDIVSPSTNALTKYIIQQKYLISQGQEDYKYVSNANNLVIILPNQGAIGSLSQYLDGQYFYFADTQVVKKYNKSQSSLNPSLDYKVYVGRDNLKFQYIHNADYDSRIDPGSSNIMDVYVLTTAYDTRFRQWVANGSPSGMMPLPPSSGELTNLLAPQLDLIKSISDEIIYHPVGYVLLFGKAAEISFRANFNVVMNPRSTASVNDVTSRIIIAINQFFALDNWNFGDTFYFTELSTYVMTLLVPDITNFVIVPIQGNLYFGSLFEIRCPSNQLFISCATAADINIVSGYTSGNLKTLTGSGLSSVVTTQNITSATFGAING